MNLFFKLSYQESTPYILEKFDIVIIGGGINGCGIARDAAGRGLKVLICEKMILEARHRPPAQS